MIWNFIIRPIWHLICSLFGWDPQVGPSWGSDVAMIVLCLAAFVGLLAACWAVTQ